MMGQWIIPVSYGLLHYDLVATLEYHSNQIMRIRVKGKHSTLLLENDYPSLISINSKKGIHWKIKEGKFDLVNQKSSRLFQDILKELEYNIKKQFPNPIS
jgi:hypothetical protein